MTSYFEILTMYAIVFLVLFFANLTFCKRKKNGTYLVINLIFIAFCVWELFWYRIDGNPDHVIANRIGNQAYMVFYSFLGYLWYCYVTANLPSGIAPGKKIKSLLAVIPAASSLFMLLTADKGYIFTINSGFRYERGPYYHLVPAVSYAFMLIGTVYSLIAAAKVPDKKRKFIYVSQSFFILPTVACNIAQIFFDLDIPLSYFGSIISMIILLTSDVREITLKDMQSDYEKNAFIALLASSYDFVCSVNVSSNTIHPYKMAGSFERFSVFTNNDGTLYPRDFDKIFRQLIPSSQFHEFLKAVDRTTMMVELLRHKIVDVDFQIEPIESDSRMWVRMRLALEENSENVIIGVKSIEKQKKYEADLENALNEADRANKSKSLFLFNMSHDIRTPMNAIIGFTEIAEKSIDDKEKLTDCLSKVKMSGHHLLNLINDVLDMSKIDNGKVQIIEEACSITGFSHDIETMLLSSATDAGLSFKTSCLGIENDYVFADRLHLNQILINVVSNSIKYTNRGGAVALSIYQLPEPDEEFRRYRFVIADTGIGMSKEFLEHIFDPFERETTGANSKITGTGLGMAITKRLTDALGGTIGIESEVGKGTVTTLEFSFRPSDPPAGNAETEKGGFDLSGKRILLTEDNELNREIAVEILNDAGITVECAENGSEAVQAMENAADGHFDAILMDIQMPIMDGYEATKAIRGMSNTRKAGIPIIAMSANAFEEDKAASIKAGMNAHVAKPVNVKELITILGKYIK